jgi:hypothetical protein
MDFMGSRRGTTTSAVLMVLAFAGMVGFLYWLALSARSFDVDVVEETTDDSGAGMLVMADSFGVDPMAFSGTIIRLENLPVQGPLGTQAFFVRVPNQPGPYLVKMGAVVAADSIVIVMEDIVRVVGNVYMMTDSIADSWVADGAITEDEKIVATFAESFIEALEVEITGSVPGGN